MRRQIDCSYPDRSQRELRATELMTFKSIDGERVQFNSTQTMCVWHAKHVPVHAH